MVAIMLVATILALLSVELLPEIEGPPLAPLVRLTVVLPLPSISSEPLLRSDENARPGTTWYCRTASKVAIGKSLMSDTPKAERS